MADVTTKGDLNFVHQRQINVLGEIMDTFTLNILQEEARINGSNSTFRRFLHRMGMATGEPVRKVC